MSKLMVILSLVLTFAASIDAACDYILDKTPTKPQVAVHVPDYANRTISVNPDGISVMVDGQHEVLSISEIQARANRGSKVYLVDDAYRNE